MKKKFIILIAFIVCVMLLYSFNSKVELVICPDERREVYDRVKDRMALRRSGYMALIVQHASGGVMPVQHYRTESTFTYRLHETDTSWHKPTRISNLMIFDRPDGRCGVAVRRDGDVDWRILWFADRDLKRDVVYLPPYEDLEILKGKRIERSASG